MKRLLSIVLILAAPLAASAQSTYTMSRFFHFTGAAYDMSTTLKAESNPNIHETNPILGTSPARQIALETGMTLLLDRITHHMAHQEDHSAWILNSRHPKRTATIMNIVFGSVHVAAGTWNIHVMRNAR